MKTLPNCILHINVVDNSSYIQARAPVYTGLSEFLSRWTFVRVVVHVYTAVLIPLKNLVTLV